MFDIGFSELLLVFIIGLVVLGPQRLPVAVKTVLGWIRALRSLATTVQNELAQELKLQELQDSLKKVEKASLDNLSPELKSSMDELRKAAESMRRSYHLPEVAKASDAINSILSPAMHAEQPPDNPSLPAAAEPTATDAVQTRPAEADLVAVESAKSAESSVAEPSVNNNSRTRC